MLKGPNPAELMSIVEGVEDKCGAMAAVFEGPSPEKIALAVDAASGACDSRMALGDGSFPAERDTTKL